MRVDDRYEMDMCSGSIPGKMVRFCVPLMLTSILQLLFNAADIVVVGRYAGSTALAAVGSTGALINLIINVLMGMSIGTGVLVAQFYGGGREKDVSETVHTSIAISLVGGVGVGILGICICRPMLEWMGTPDNVIQSASLYMTIYFAGLPAMSIYTFGAAVLRAVGDTKRPLYFLSLAGCINVALNLFFVVVLHMEVDGVALATVISQCVSAAMIVICLLRSSSCIRLVAKQVRFHGDKLKAILKIGLPAGIQGSVFSISNVVIQASVNSFGAIAMAGNSAAGNLEGFVYQIMNSFYQGALSFTGQNMGAGKIERVKKTFHSAFSLVTLFGVVFGGLFTLFGKTLLGIYSPDEQVIAYGLNRLKYVCFPYFLCGQMDTMVGMMRGMGYSLTPMIVSMVGVVGFRLGWIYTVFAANRTLSMLYISYPISWFITMAVHMGCFIFAYRRVKSRFADSVQLQEIKQ